MRGTAAPEHRGVVVDCDHVVACGRERNGNSARAGHQLEHRYVRRICQREVHVDVARVVSAQIEVVVAS